MAEIDTKDFYGSWSLVSFEVGKAGGILRNWGDDISGLLIYSPSGHMSAAINRNISKERFSLDDCLFYAGEYAVKSGGKVIEHLVKNATDSNRIGQNLVRNVALDSGTLTLTGKSKSGSIFVLKWQRL